MRRLHLLGVPRVVGMALLAQVNYQYKPVVQFNTGGKPLGPAEIKSALLVAIAGKSRGLKASEVRPRSTIPGTFTHFFLPLAPSWFRCLPRS